MKKDFDKTALNGLFLLQKIYITLDFKIYLI